jgi:ubiquinone/menaquinone biosynthesis C-methylase UbiE
VPEEPGPPPAHLASFVAGLPEAEHVLDLGCGDGRLSSLLRARVLTAADVSSVAVRRASDAEVALVGLDEPLPFVDNEFELVLCAEVLEHVRDVQLFLSEVRRVLRPGGGLALTTPAWSRWSAVWRVAFGAGFEREFDPLSPHIRFFSRRSLRDLLDAMGFKVDSMKRRHGTLFVRATR